MRRERNEKELHIQEGEYIKEKKISEDFEYFRKKKNYIETEEREWRIELHIHKKKIRRI